MFIFFTLNRNLNILVFLISDCLPEENLLKTQKITISLYHIRDLEKMSKLKKRFIKEVAKAEDILMQAQLDSEGYFSTEVNIMMYSIAELTGAIKDLMIKENQE